MIQIPTLTLNDGVDIPVFGFGTFRLPPDGSTYRAVREALDLGIRHIDTAAAYFNEHEVGQAIRDSGLARESVFVTSKLWLQDYGFEAAQRGIETSRQKLDLGYIDLYLIHQPYGDVAGAWKAMEKAKDDGILRSIGVSNMTPAIWDALRPTMDTVPSVNQVEFHPFQQQRKLRERLRQEGVALEAWAPLAQGDPALLEHPTLVSIGEALGRTPAQVALRFALQEGAILFPKTSHRERLISNLEILNFSLEEKDMTAIRALDKAHGIHDPDAPGVAAYLLSHFDVHAQL